MRKVNITDDEYNEKKKRFTLDIDIDNCEFLNKVLEEEYGRSWSQIINHMIRKTRDGKNLKIEFWGKDF